MDKFSSQSKTKTHPVDILRIALNKIIEMNRQTAKDKYGDANKAESWSCVVIARKALAETQPNDFMLRKRE